RQTVLEGLNASAGQTVLEPVQLSSTSHTPAAARHTVPAFPAGCWQSSLLPSHSSRLHGVLPALHAVPAALFASAGQLGPFPGQSFAPSTSLFRSRQTVLEGLNASAGQTVLEPVQLSSTSHTPAAARHTVPAFPAGCWQSSLLPSHSSRLHGLPSLVHAVPAALLAPPGHCGSFPGQSSAGSPPPAYARHFRSEGLKASAGQTVLEPVQLSSTSHTPAAARHTVPAFPAGCWQVTFVPSHWSSVQGLPSEVHAVPLGDFASAGQLGPLPGQFSAGSHSPAEARHCV